jgi:hypothetical protein
MEDLERARYGDEEAGSNGFAAVSDHVIGEVNVNDGPQCRTTEESEFFVYAHGIF